jgi:putative transposase
MAYDADKHHRSSARLKTFDYASNAAYFITVCTNVRTNVFGEIVDGEMRLNDAGKMIQQKWLEMPASFPTLVLDESIVMPDHIHGILLFVGAGLVPALPDQRNLQNIADQLNGSDLTTELNGRATTRVAPTENPILGNVIGAFKSITTNRYIRGVHEQSWLPFEKRLWQRNYWDRVIRDDRELEETRKYILENPVRSFERLVS